MRFEKTSLAGVDFFVVDTWEARGFPHGFFGRTFNGRTQQNEFVEFLETRHSQTLSGLKLLKQVHGKAYCEVRREIPHPEQAVEADAWLLRGRQQGNKERQAAYGILTADCVPVIVTCRGGLFGESSEQPLWGESSILHCGWRSSVLGLLPVMLAKICSTGRKPQDLEVAIGPGAQRCCYEVSPDFLGEVSQVNPHIQLGIETREGAFFFDNSALLKAQALTFGVPPAQLAVSSSCTICEAEFFSHRREKQQAGRQLSYILGPG